MGSFRNFWRTRIPRQFGERCGIRPIFVPAGSTGRDAPQRCDGQYWRNTPPEGRERPRGHLPKPGSSFSRDASSTKEDDQIGPYVAAGPLSAKLFEERNLENLQGLPARHAHYASGHVQFLPAGVPQALNDFPLRVSENSRNRGHYSARCTFYTHRLPSFVPDLKVTVIKLLGYGKLTV